MDFLLQVTPIFEWTTTASADLADTESMLQHNIFDKRSFGGSKGMKMREIMNQKVERADPTVTAVRFRVAASPELLDSVA